MHGPSSFFIRSKLLCDVGVEASAEKTVVILLLILSSLCGVYGWNFSAPNYLCRGSIENEHLGI